ncbi:GlcG/HbpS family heme-binding protein [Parendozoicomonas haliclonae]|uniref:Heme-binding protein n=1 Tax=Parendozoicomonas haliclonae TaxID=1960125 RepID=A0A1X7ARU4_9GAMM|nr:heme-binding protein [Parendozoicomonas haliclonae]SMA50137.1 hypothetical protein EHSB41UT_03928 [Parendozoicomonas haliclonae]
MNDTGPTFTAEQTAEITRKVVSELLVADKPAMTLDKARRLVELGKEEARKAGIALVFAVVDGAGHIVVHERMDGSLLAAVEVARYKAHTALSMAMPTEQVGELVKEGGDFYGLGHSFEGRLVTFGGGRPVFEQNQLIGGFGVSGGSSEQDIRIARTCLQACFPVQG